MTVEHKKGKHTRGCRTGSRDRTMVADGGAQKRRIGPDGWWRGG